MSTDRKIRIRRLNDRLRTAPSVVSALFGRTLVSHGIASLDLSDQVAIMDKVRTFDTFTPDNDPHGEHDFGAIQHEGLKVLWKIDYYTPDLDGGSADPSDPLQTCRVLTVMLAEEY